MSSVASASLKRSPLHEEHVRLGAKMTEFGGFEMPVQYQGIREEHLAVRNHCGLFDASHMGEIEVLGHDRKAFVNYLLTNDVDRVEPGRTQYSLLCQDDGGVVDDLFVMDMGDRYILVVNASNAETDYAWIRARAEGFRLRYSSPRVQPVGGASSPPEDREVTVNDISDQFALLALQGPRAEDVLTRVLGVTLSHLKYFQFDEFEFRGEKMIVSRTGYTGEDGFEILLPPALSPDLWRGLLELELDGRFVTPCGLGSRDSLRLEMGYSLYGHELSSEINPYEAGVGFAVRLDKGEFIGSPALARIKASGPSRRAIALQLTERGVPRAGDRVSFSGEDIGYVTSGGYSPVLERGIAMALVDVRAASALGQTQQAAVSIVQRQRSLAAQVVKLPFVPSRVKR